MIDLRSDTVTLPCAEMKEVMFTAPVGDDVFEEDPSIHELQDYVANLFGKEDAIFCASGTMTNQIAMRIHLGFGQQVICHEDAHIYKYEGGGIASNSGATVQLLKGNRGRFSASQVLDSIQPDDVHFPETSLVSIEDTANRGGGAIYNFEEIKRISNLCVEKELKFHVDGARLFNGLVETGISEKAYGALFDTISICLSKGLGAPVGSLLLGTHKDILKARRIRKSFGGGMRQAGSLAAAGLYALKNNVDRLKIDHERAKSIGNVLINCETVKNILPVETNIIIFELKKENANEIVTVFKENGIHAIAFAKDAIRFVFHKDLTDLQLDELATKIPTLI